MKALRNLVALAAVALLCGGYIGSQAALLQGRAPEFAYRMDQPSVRIFALVLLVGAIVMSLIPEAE
jgi:hypothetical protein